MTAKRHAWEASASSATVQARSFLNLLMASTASASLSAGGICASTSTSLPLAPAPSSLALNASATREATLLWPATKAVRSASKVVFLAVRRSWRSCHLSFASAGAHHSPWRLAPASASASRFPSCAAASTSMLGQPSHCGHAPAITSRPSAACRSASLPAKLVLRTRRRQRVKVWRPPLGRPSKLCVKFVAYDQPSASACCPELSNRQFVGLLPGITGASSSQAQPGARRSTSASARDRQLSLVPLTR
mmetsp:Transcript_45877/g.132883  ORF Transcript_45877/g.132883 Transcript_45877/m.132883 type:complete len:248 (+) Transcript_45877:630-1373(+)